MPYAFVKKKLKIPKELDRRRKLTDEQIQEIKELYGTISQRKLARMYGVSRRLIVFYGDPEQRKRNLELRKGKNYYYGAEKQREYVRNYRRYKKKLYDNNLLKGEK